MPVRRSKRQEKYAAKRTETVRRDTLRYTTAANANIALLVSMGFDTEISAKTIHKCRNDIHVAIDKLLQMAVCLPVWILSPEARSVRSTPPVSPARCMAVKCSHAPEPEHM